MAGYQNTRSMPAVRLPHIPSLTATRFSARAHQGLFPIMMWGAMKQCGSWCAGCSCTCNVIVCLAVAHACAPHDILFPCTPTSHCHP